MQYHFRALLFSEKIAGICTQLGHTMWLFWTGLHLLWQLGLQGC